MAITDPTDHAVAEADRRVERAKASLRSRFELLERRFVDVRDRLDLPEHIRRHPWPAVGVALALGAFAGRGSSGTAIVAASQRSHGRTALGLLGKIAFRLVRELALAQLGLAARRWIDDHGGSFSGSVHDTGGSVHDTGASYSPGVERYPGP